MSAVTGSLKKGARRLGQYVKRAAITMAVIFEDGLALNVEYLGRTENQDHDAPDPDPGIKVVIVVHATATKRGVSARALCIRHLLRRVMVSSWNYIIDDDAVATVFWYVDELIANAWHAGVSKMFRGKWAGRLSGWIRRHSVGIEIVNPNDGSRLTPAQLVSLEKVIRRIMRRLRIKKLVIGENFVMHFDIAPGRKTDARCVQLQELVDRINVSEPPVDGKPPTGTYFVNTTGKVPAKIRKGPSTTSAEMGKVVWGTRVWVVEWVKGDVVSGNAWWAKLQPDHYIAGALLSATPVHATLVGMTKTGTHFLARAFADRVTVALGGQVDVIQCGGFAEDGALGEEQLEEPSDI